MSSITVRFLVLLLVAALPVFAVQVSDQIEQRDQQRAHTIAQANRFAHAVAEEQERLIEGMRYLLTALAQLPSVRNHEASCSARLADIAHPLLSIGSLGAATPDGKVFCVSSPADKPANIADHGYFREAVRRKSFVVGSHFEGNSGERAIGFAYPSLDESGKVVAVVGASFDLAKLSEQLSKVPLPSNATVSVIDRGGILLARYPAAPGLIGRDLHGFPPVEAGLRRDTRILRATDIDGQERFFGNASLMPSAEMSVLVGLPLAGVFDEVESTFTRELLLISLIFLVAGLVAVLLASIWIRRPVAALQQSVMRMASGDLSVRASPGKSKVTELASLADSFNHMAAALQHREAELRHQMGVTRTITENMTSGLFMVDRNGCPTFMNPAAERLTGFRLEEIKGTPLHDSIHCIRPDGAPYPASECPLAEAYRESKPLKNHEDVFVRKDGGLFPVSCSVTPLEEEGEAVGTVTEFVDITERKKAEESQRLLNAELDHRVKNILATIQSLLVQTSHGSHSLDAFVEAFKGRIGAMAQTHGLLSQKKGTSASLRALADGELSPYAATEDGNVAIRGNDILLSARTATALSMGLHELATNAAKYGALSVTTGRVDLSWGVEETTNGRHLMIDWTESGGPPVRQPQKPGFGCTVIEQTITYQLGGTVSHMFLPDGVRCRMVVPLLPTEREAIGEPADMGIAAVPEESKEIAWAGKRILLVEDEILIAMDMRNRIVDWGCTVVGPVSRVDQALDVVETEHLDAAVLDINIDGERIDSVAARLLERNVPFVFTTGYATGPVLPERFAGIPTVQKPFSEKDLKNALGNAVAGRVET